MEEGKIIGTEIISLATIDSTNDYLQKALSDGSVAEGLVVSAEEQMKGRGQRGTQWHSNRGHNILMSTVLYPSFLPIDKQFYLSVVMALGVAGFVRSVLPSTRVQIKWPNDILVEEKKVGGILIENSLQGNILKNSIAGIGINVLARPETNTAWPAVCLAHFGQVGKPGELIPVLCDWLDLFYKELKSGESESLYKEYMANLYSLRETRIFTDLGTGQNFTGSITGIDGFGRLLVAGPEGEKAYSLKEISLKSN
jgi:BirA family biotin operon repressor/biotin-[acetyl-CoA-carboxylase] ligase